MNEMLAKARSWPEAERKAMVLDVLRQQCGRLDPEDLQAVADDLCDRSGLPHFEVAEEIAADVHVIARLGELLREAHRRVAKGETARQRRAMGWRAVVELSKVHADRDDLDHAARHLSDALGVDIDVDRALAPREASPFSEQIAAATRPPVDQTREKDRHVARVRVPRARPRERRASRARSRAAPSSDSEGGSEPPAAPLPLGAVAVLLEAAAIPYWIDAELIVSAWCPRCSSGCDGQGVWFHSSGASCAYCPGDAVLDALMALPPADFWLDGSK